MRPWPAPGCARAANRWGQARAPRLLLLPLLLALGRSDPPWADAAEQRHVESSPPPARVNGSRIFFQNVTHSSAVVRWAPPDRGDWDLDVEGYRLRIRSFLYTEEMFDLSFVDPDER